MKFKESKSLIEEGIEREGTILISMKSNLYDSIVKKSKKEGGDLDKGMEFIMESFSVFWEDSIYNKDENQWDDYLIINDKSWNQFLSLIG